MHKISRERDNQLPARDASSPAQSIIFPPRGPSIFIQLCLSLNTGKSNAPVPLTRPNSLPPRGSAYSHYPETSEWGVNHSRLKSQKNLPAKNYVCRGLETGPATGTLPVSVWTKSTWQDLVRFGTFFAHFRRKMEIRKNFLDFACRWEMRLMWRAFLYRGRGNGKRLDLIGFAPLQERGSASAGGVRLDRVVRSAGPGLSPAHGLDHCGRSKLLAGGMVGDWRSPEGGRWSSSHYGWTLVTDGRVDDRLVWWFQHSKLSAWLSVRVSQVVISVLLAGRRVVMEDVQSEIIWPSQISGQPCWMEMSPMVGWPGLAVGIWMENDGIYTTSLTCGNIPTPGVPRN